MKKKIILLAAILKNKFAVCSLQFAICISLLTANCLLPTFSFGQNFSFNTTGATNSTLSMVEILQLSTTANSRGLYISHSGDVGAGNTGYGIWAEKTGGAGSTINIAGYFAASGGANNYALIVPASSGFVGIGTLVPATLFHVDGGAATTTQTAATIQANSLTSGTALNVTSSGTLTGNLVSMTGNSATTGNLLYISGTGLTSGNGVFIQGPTAGATLTGNLLRVQTASTGAAASGFIGFNLSGAHTGNGFQISDGTATGTAIAVIANSLSTGTGLNISSTSTAGNSSRLINLARSGANGAAGMTNYGIYSDITNTGATSTNISGYFTAGGATTANYGVRGINTSAISGSAGVHGNGVANADGYLGYVLPTTTYGAVSVTNPGGYFTGNGNTPLSTISNGTTSALIASSMSATGGRAGNFSIENPNADGLRVVHNAVAGAGTGSGIYTTTNQSAGGCLVGWNLNTTGTGVLGGGNNVAAIDYFVNGSGAAFTGTRYGLYADQLNGVTLGTGYYWGQNFAGIQGDGAGGGVANEIYHFGVYGNMWVNALAGAQRTGGVLGAHEDNDSYNAFGILGYRSGAPAYFGVYGSSAYAFGGGFLSSSEIQGVGGAFYGGIMGGWMRGEVTGFTAAGELYASYNLGNEYTSGVQADIITLNNKRVAAYSLTSTGIKVYDDGTAKLTNGKTRVNFDEKFAMLLSEEIPTVTVSPMGKCNGIFITNIDRTGFDVEEQNSGVSNVQFSYIVVGKRIDAGKHELPEDLQALDFDDKLKGVMFNEADTEHSGTPMWWDGTKIRFDEMPETKTDLVKTKKGLSKMPVRIEDERQNNK